MNHKSLRTAVALSCATALALPAGASAGSFDTAVREVRQHTTSADRALDRAQSLFERHRAGEAARSFAQSRRSLRIAQRQASRLRRLADSDGERAAAARAHALVAGQQDENVEQLVGLLDEAGGRLESEIARAALADTRGRDKAIAVITALMGTGVAEQALPGLTWAIAALSQDRYEEIQAEAEALASDEVSSASQRVVGTTVDAAVDGQSVAAAKLAELIASGAMPAESRDGLQRAYDAVTGEQERSAEILVEFSDRMPERIRSFVEQIVQQARENAQGMRDNRPSWPTGGGPEGSPYGAPGGAPEGSPYGAPEGSPYGAPEGSPYGAPGGAPYGSPYGSPQGTPGA